MELLPLGGDPFKCLGGFFFPDLGGDLLADFAGADFLGGLEGLAFFPDPEPVFLAGGFEDAGGFFEVFCRDDLGRVFSSSLTTFLTRSLTGIDASAMAASA